MSPKPRRDPRSRVTSEIAEEARQTDSLAGRMLEQQSMHFDIVGQQVKRVSTGEEKVGSYKTLEIELANNTIIEIVASNWMSVKVTGPGGRFTNDLRAASEELKQRAHHGTYPDPIKAQGEALMSGSPTEIDDIDQHIAEATE